MSDSDTQDVLGRAVIRLLRPLVRILLRHGVPFKGFAELARRAYVQEAFREFGVPGRKASNSRVSVITGLSRKEVQRLRDLPVEQERAEIVRYNRAARVVFGWVHDPRYQADSLGCLDLPLEGELSFSALVKKYSGDIPPRAILDELLQVGVVTRLGDGQLRLVERAYIPSAGKGELLRFLGTDVGGLLTTMDNNIHDLGEPLFQRKVYYDNLPEQALPLLRRMVQEKGQPMLEEFDRWLAQHDRDVKPDVQGHGRRGAGIGIYYFEDDPDEEN